MVGHRKINVACRCCQHLAAKCWYVCSKLAAFPNTEHRCSWHRIVAVRLTLEQPVHITALPETAFVALVSLVTVAISGMYTNSGACAVVGSN
jgi:hypothetical protein